MGDLLATELTIAAFDEYRVDFGPAREPNRDKVANDDELRQISTDDGLVLWADGPGGARPLRPTSEQLERNPRHLWVVRLTDVVRSEELSLFSRSLESQRIKHTNLTGGDLAFAGGELIIIDPQTICITGWSGRYPVRSAAELEAVARAFQKSGYAVWSMGFDDEALRPLPFVGAEPRWVA